MKFKATLVLVVFLAGVLAQASPRRIIFTRHAEKHTYEESADGQVRVRGCERAYALPTLFSEKPAQAQGEAASPPFEAPVVVYAVRPSPDYKALRASQTAAPTAAKFRVPLIVKYTKDQYSEIAKEILENPAYNDKTVLVVWEHHVIPKLTAAFGLAPADNPQKWPDAVFDEAWVLDYDTGTGKVSRLQIVPENLLPGDNPLGGKKDWVKSRNIADGADECELSPNQTRLKSLPPSPCADNQVLNTVLETLSPGLIPAVSAMVSVVPVEKQRKP